MTLSALCKSKLRHLPSIAVCAVISLAFLVSGCSTHHNISVALPASPNATVALKGQTPHTVSIYSNSPILLDAAALAAVVSGIVPEAQVHSVQKAKPGEDPFLISWGETEMRLIAGYDGNFSKYLSLALHPAVRASTQTKDSEASLRQITGGIQGVVWIQIANDVEGRALDVVFAIAKQVNGIVYAPISFYDSNRNLLWYGSGNRL